jgi:regulatory protein
MSADDEVRFVPEPVAEIVGERSHGGHGRRRQKKRPRKVTERYLRNVARWYVERYAPCTSQLRRALMKRVNSGLREHGGDREEALAWVEVVITQQVHSGAVNDAAYALAWAESYYRRGKALRDIRYRLRGKGLDTSVADEAMRQLESSLSGDPDLAAACAYARRRRLGPFRMLPEKRAARAEKDLAAMMRAGHRYTHVKRVLGCEDLSAFTRLHAEANGDPPPEL